MALNSDTLSLVSGVLQSSAVGMQLFAFFHKSHHIQFILGGYLH